jgi:hypothetical protein
MAVCGIDPDKPMIDYSSAEFDCLKITVMAQLKYQLGEKFDSMSEGDLRTYCMAHEQEFSEMFGIPVNRIALMCEAIIQERKAAGTDAEIKIVQKPASTKSAGGKGVGPLPKKYQPSHGFDGARIKIFHK